MKQPPIVIVCFLAGAIAMLVGGCSSGGNNSQPTNGYQERFGEIQWPKKYWQSASGWIEVTAPVTLGYGETFNCWATLNYTDGTAGWDSLDQEDHILGSTQTTTFGFDFHNPPEGRYLLTLGLRARTDSLYLVVAAQEVQRFTLYVGQSYYFFDVDVEYDYQSGLDILNVYSDDDFQTMAKPLTGSKVVFTHRTGSKSPLDLASVTDDPDALVTYRKKHSGYWDPDTLRPKSAYVLFSIDYFTKLQTGERDSEALGRSQVESKVAFVAAGNIDQQCAYDFRADLKQETAAHELAHLLYLTDYCDDNTAHVANTVARVCMMTDMFVVGSPNGSPNWGCGQVVKDFDNSYFLCDSCKNRLNDLDFLFQGNVPKILSRGGLTSFGEEK